MSTTHLAFVAAVLVPFTLHPPAIAQTRDSDRAPVQTISGQVMTAHDDTLVISTAAGEEKAFVLDTNVTVPKGTSPGHRVTVTYRSSEAGPPHAVGVKLEEEELQPPGQVPPEASLALRAVSRAAD